MTSPPGPPPQRPAKPTIQSQPQPPPQAQPQPLRGGRVVASGLLAGVAGLAIALFLRALVANTPVRVSSYTLFWGTVLVVGFGVVAGMAVEAVRQLRDRITDPEYRHPRSGRRFERRP